MSRRATGARTGLWFRSTNQTLGSTRPAPGSDHGTVTLDPVFQAKTPEVSGINLAFAVDVATELQAKVDAASQTPRKIKHHKRLSHLHKHFFGLNALFCPSGDWQGE